MTNPKPEKHLTQILTKAAEAFADKSFVDLRLTSYRGNAQLKRIIVRPVKIKTELVLNLRVQYRTREIQKNLSSAEAWRSVREYVTQGFSQITLRTTAVDVECDLVLGKLKTRAATVDDKPSLDHDRKRVRSVELSAPYLKELGIVGNDGQLRRERMDKYRQIEKFVEIVKVHLAEFGKNASGNFHVADFGSGRNYLTFALYDFLKSERSENVKVLGIDRRDDLVAEGNAIAAKAGYKGLSFIVGRVAATELKTNGMPEIDVAVALHACDTATDEAITAALGAEAKLIIVAPCCHKFVRGHMAAPNTLRPIVEHGIHAERMAVMVTDTLRGLRLEAAGYRTKVFEFIDSDHTDKNVMIVAQKGGVTTAFRRKAEARMQDLMTAFSLENFFPASKK